MFFIGLLIGAGIYFIAFLVWYKFGSMRWAVGIAIALCIGLGFISPRICGGSVAGLVVVAIIAYFIAKKRADNESRRKSEIEGEKLLEQSYYKSHCWHCGNSIDGSWNRRCPDCNKYYICPNCGACKCDYDKQPPFKH